jgi:ethanolamine utilization protein EutN
MNLGRVIGSVWSTAKNPGLHAQRMLFVQPVNENLEDAGKPLICTDSCGAGAGELIYWVRGREASMPFRPAEVPTDATIVAIVDELRVRKDG